MVRRAYAARSLLPLLLLLPLPTLSSAIRGAKSPRYGIPRLAPGQDQMEFLDFSAKTTHNMTIQHPPDAEDKGRPAEDVARAITYELHLPDRQTVIALFQSRSLSLSDLARLYPAGSNFRFSDQALQKRLALKGVPPEFISAGIRLLHRGGKIALPRAQGWSDWLIAEVTPSGQVDVLEPPSSPPK